jgi:hypothetical protein
MSSPKCGECWEPIQDDGSCRCADKTPELIKARRIASAINEPARRDERGAGILEEIRDEIRVTNGLLREILKATKEIAP